MKTDQIYNTSRRTIIVNEVLCFITNQNFRLHYFMFIIRA